MGNRQVVERYARALAAHDVNAMDAVRHEEYEGRYPQSGEVVRGRDKAHALEEQFELAAEGPQAISLDRIVGGDDQFLPGPSWNIIHLTGSGDDFTVAGTITYRNGETWHAVSLLTFREGKIWREVAYFAAPFERPEWRIPFTELEPQAQMAPLGALSQAQVSAEASPPLGWRIAGLWRFDELWVTLAGGPTFDD